MYQGKTTVSFDSAVIIPDAEYSDISADLTSLAQSYLRHFLIPTVSEERRIIETILIPLLKGGVLVPPLSLQPPFIHSELMDSVKESMEGSEESTLAINTAPITLTHASMALADFTDGRKDVCRRALRDCGDTSGSDATLRWYPGRGPHGRTPADFIHKYPFPPLSKS